MKGFCKGRGSPQAYKKQLADNNYFENVGKKHIVSHYIQLWKTETKYILHALIGIHEEVETFKHFCRTNLPLSNMKPREKCNSNKMSCTQRGYLWSFTFQVQQKAKWHAFEYILGVLKEYEITFPFRHHKNEVLLSFIFSLKHFVHRYIILKYSHFKNAWRKNVNSSKICIQTRAITYILKDFLTISVSNHMSKSSKYITTRIELICIIKSSDPVNHYPGTKDALWNYWIAFY